MGASRILTEIKQTKPFTTLEQEVAVAFMRTADHLRRMKTGIFEAHDLTEQQYNVLRILRGAGADGLCRNEIRDRLVSRMPDVTRLLDRLELLGLVRRERRSEDRRQVSTYLTDAGSEVLLSLDRPVADENERQWKHMTDEQIRTFIALCTIARQAD